MRRPTLRLAAAAFTVALAREAGAASAPQGPSFTPAEELALAMVVDEAALPEEAAALEARPYRVFLGKVRLGPGERTLRPLAAAAAGDERVAREPERFRGQVVHGFGILGEVRRVDAPGVGRFDRDEVYAGTVGTPQGRFFAFRALRRPTDAPLYPGDRIWVLGYFMKMTPVEDARGGRHRMPLVVSPWPTYTGKWWPAGVAKAMAGELGLPLPTREVPHEDVLSRLVIDLPPGEEGGTGGLAVDGVPMLREDILGEMRRSAAAHPGRAMVVRTPSGGEEPAARALLEEAGVEGAVFKRLPQGQPDEAPATPQEERT